MNGIHVTCRCGQQFLADMDRAGQSLPCPYCGAAIQVPQASRQVADSAIWHVRFPDGRQVGPVTKAQLDEAALNGQITGDSQVACVGGGAAVTAAELYPQLGLCASLPPAPLPATLPRQSAIGSRFQQDMQHLASNPLGYLVSGPKRPAYKRREIGGAWTAWYVVVLLGTGFLGLLVFGFGALRSLQQGNGQAFGLSGMMFLVFTAGMFCLAGALLQWRFFFESRKAKGMRDLFGDSATRTIYIVIGLGFVVIPCLAVIGGIVLMPAPSSRTTSIAPVRRPSPSGGSQAARAQAAREAVSPPGRPLPNTDFGIPPIDPQPQGTSGFTLPLRIGFAREAVTVGGVQPLLFATRQTSGEQIVEAFDLHTGEMVRNTAVSAYSVQGTVLAGAPDASRVVFVTTSHRNTLALCSLGESTQEPQSSWQPHGGDRVVWGEFLSPTRLLTWSGGLKLWSLPNVREEYHIACSFPSLTPGRRYVVTTGGAFIQFLDAETARPAGSLRLDKHRLVQHTAVSQDGKRLAAITTGTQHNTLVCWELETRRVICNAAIPKTYTDTNVHSRTFHQAVIQWLGADYVMCGDYLVSVDEQQVVWRFTDRDNSVAALDDRLWVTKHIKTPSLFYVVAPVSVPDAALESRLQSSGRPQQVVQPGERFSIERQFQISAPSEFRQALDTLIEQRLADAGLQLAQSQQRKLRVTIADEGSGEMLQFGIFRENPTRYAGRAPANLKQVIDVPDKRLTCKVAILDTSGNVVWECHSSVSAAQIPEVEIGFFDRPTAEWFLNKRWKVLQDQLAQSLKFEPEVWSFAAVRSSPMDVPISDAWLANELELETQRQAELAAARRIEHQAEAERRAPKITLPRQPPSTVWRVEPDPHPAIDDPMLRRTMPLAPGSVKNIRFAPHVGHAVVHLAEDEVSNKPALHRFSLRDKKRLARTPLNENASLLDLRPDGQVWLLWPAQGQKKLEVWKCGDAEDKLLVEVALSEERALKEAAFVGRSGLLVFDGREIFARRLPKGELAYRREMTTDRCWLSWGRKYFVDWAGSRLGIFSTGDGQLAGLLAPLPIGGTPKSARFSDIERRIKAVAFRPDSKLLAVLVEVSNPRESMVGIWSLENGSIVTWLQVPSAESSMHWTSPNHLLIGSTLFDLQREAPVWDYAGFLEASPDGRGWYVVKDRRDVVHLAAISLPSQYVVDAVEKITKHARGQLLPDEAISLEIICNGAIAEEFAGFEARVREIITAKLSENKRRVLPDQAKVLRVSCDLSSYNRDNYLLNNGSSDFIIPNRSYQVRMQLTNSGWTKQLSLELPDIDYAIDSSDDDPVGALRRRQEAALLTTLEQLTIPDLSFHFPHRFWKGYGKSQYGISGEQLTVDPTYRGYLDAR